MKLIASITSPFVRKVRVLIREAGKTNEVEELMVATTPFATDSSVIAANPLGKIPALIRDSGPALYDSRVITRYLDAEWNLGLYPTDRRWDVLTLEATADAILEAAVAIVYEARMRPAEFQYPDWVEAQWAKIDRALTAVEERWVSNLLAPLDMGQIAMGVALSYVDFRLGDRNWRATRPELAKWHADFAARKSMTDTVPE